MSCIKCTDHCVILSWVWVYHLVDVVSWMKWFYWEERATCFRSPKHVYFRSLSGVPSKPCKRPLLSPPRNRKSCDRKGSCDRKWGSHVTGSEGVMWQEGIIVVANYKNDTFCIGVCDGYDWLHYVCAFGQNSLKVVYTSFLSFARDTVSRCLNFCVICW